MMVSHDLSSTWSDLEKKEVITDLVQKITVYFDPDENKHRIDVEFREEVQIQRLGLSAKPETSENPLRDVQTPSEGCSMDEGAGGRQITTKKHRDWMTVCPPEQNYSVTVE